METSQPGGRANMHLSNILDRVFRDLAGQLKYDITESEIGLYVNELSDMGLFNVSEACLAFKTEDMAQGLFPSVLEFRRKMIELKSERPQKPSMASEASRT